ncbi:hypothetical protein [Winogradskyella sp.]|uniref:hypothetical protein n=1 Tax=Winogradskyella sp. TaxID=1883156 RepID=UPI00261B5513|nr:hypothetical protein [uncultured Winogradskyella sp.]
MLYATDWAFEYLVYITQGGADYLSFYEPDRSGTSLSTEAEMISLRVKTKKSQAVSSGLLVIIH